MQRLTLGSSSTRAQTTFSMPSRKGKNVSKTGDNPITQTEFQGSLNSLERLMTATSKFQFIL